MPRAPKSITDEGIAAMRACIGQQHETPPWEPLVTQGAVRHFALGVGDDNPLWWEADYAGGTRWQRPFAPPTLLYSFMTHVWRPPWEEGLRHGDSFFPGAMGFWAGDRWRWSGHVYVGDEISTVLELADVEEKTGSFSGGRQIAQTLKVTFLAGVDRVIAEWLNTVIWMERTEALATRKYRPPEPHYSPDDLRAIDEQYEREPAQRRGAEVRCFDDTQVGDPLLTLVKGPLTMSGLIGFFRGWRAPMLPTNRIVHQYLRQYPGSRLFNPETGVEDLIDAGHWDPYFVNQAGLPRGFDMGGQRIAWLAHLLGDWHGDDGFLEKLDVRLHAPNFIGDTSWLTGEVTGRRARKDDGVVDCQLTVTNQRGEITASGQATVALPKASARGSR